MKDLFINFIINNYELYKMTYKMTAILDCTFIFSCKELFSMFNQVIARTMIGPCAFPEL